MSEKKKKSKGPAKRSVVAPVPSPPPAPQAPLLAGLDELNINKVPAPPPAPQAHSRARLLKQNKKSKGGPPPPPPPANDDFGDFLETANVIDDDFAFGDPLTETLAPLKKSFYEDYDPQVSGIRAGELEALQSSFSEAPNRALPSLTRSNLVDEEEEDDQSLLVRDYFPLERISSYLLSKNSKIGSILMEFCDELLDCFFLALELTPGSDALAEHMEKVSFAGCRRITDWGVAKMVKLFPNLTQVNLSGCMNLTEASMQALLKLEKLEKADLSGTKCGMLAFPDEQAEKPVFELEKCPLVSPYTTEKQFSPRSFKTLGVGKGMTPCKFHKLLSIVEDGSSVSLLEALGHKPPNGLHIGYADNIKATAIAPQLKDVSFNVIECSEVIASSVISERSIFVLPYDADGDIEKMFPSVVRRFFQVVNKVDYPIVMVLGISRKGSPVIKDLDIQPLVERNTCSSFSEKATESDVYRKLKNGANKKEPLSYKEQTLLSNLYRQNVVLLCDPLEVHQGCTAYTTIKLPEKKVDALWQTIERFVGYINKIYPHYQNISAEVFEFLSYLDTLKKKTLIYERDLIKLAMEKKLIKHFSFRHYSKVLDILEGLGKVLVLRDDKLQSPLVVLDLPEFSKTLSESFAKFDSSGNNSKLFEGDVTIDGLLNIFKTTTPGKNKQNLFVSLPVETPVDLDKKVKENLIEAKFKLLHPLSEGAIAHILHAASVPQSVDLVWKRGLIATLPPAEVRVIISEEADKCAMVSILVIIPKYPGETDSSGACKLAQHTLAMYIITVEYALQTEGLGYEYIQPVENGTEVTLDVATSGVIPSHSLTNDKEGHSKCVTCRMTPQKLDNLWRMYSVLYPTNNVPSQLKSPWKIEGCSATHLFDGDPFSDPTQSAEESFFFPTMYRGINTQLSIMTFQNSDNMSFSLILEFVNEENRDLDEKTSLSYEDLGKPTSFSTIDLRMNEEDDDCILHVTVDGMEVRKASVKDRKLTVGMSGPTDFRALVQAPLFPRQHFGDGGFPLQVGMRLEALDRKTPNLICVATIDDIQWEDGKPRLLIYFDGWTRTYDYWTEPESADLHPLGFMDKCPRSFLRGMNQNLQAPRGYKKAFDWNTYLEEEDALPVPYSFFNDAQRVGVPEFPLSREIQRKLGNLGSTLGHCAKQRSMPFVFNTNVEQLCEDESYVSSGDILGCLLPGKLDGNLLECPMPTKLFDWKNTKMHFLCPKTGAVHLSENVPLEESASPGMQSLIRPMALLLQNVLKQEYIVPDKLAWITGTDNWGLEKFNMAVKKCLKIYLSYYLMYDEVPQEPNVLQALWKNYCTNQLQWAEAEVESTGYQELAQCTAHKQATAKSMNLTAVPMERFQHHTHLIVNMDLSKNSITELPDDFFTNFPILRQLNLEENEMKTFPQRMEACKNLKTLHIADNQLTELPKTFADLKLETLNISNNPFEDFPQGVLGCKTLINLFANRLLIKELPSNFGDLEQLQILSMTESLLTSLPDSFSQLINLKTLEMGGVSWVEKDDTSNAILSHDAFEEHLKKSLPADTMSKEDRDKLFPSSKGTMNYKEIQLLNVEMYKMYPRFGKDGTPEDQEYGGVPRQIFALQNLKRLSLKFCGITRITEHIQQMTNLNLLDVSHSPELESLPGEISVLPINALKLRGCPVIKTPPKEIIARGFTTIMAYLKRLSVGSVECKRTKLMMVGLGGAGKTSLVKALTSGHYQSYGTQGENITDGIDITNWKVQEDDQEITFSVWDFAGQTVYYNTHQFFLSNRAVYFLLWNIRLGYEHAGLDFWLSSISCHAPKAPIFVVGTHADQVEKFYLPESDLKQRYSQIVGFHNVSSYIGQGVYELSQDLIKVALQQKYMGERIPEAWLNLEKHLISKRQKKAIIPWTHLVDIASESAIVDKEELGQAVSFLHDLGSLQHFENDFLKSIVVINPQWIVDVMACVVSVHDSPIVDGRLKHSDIQRVWQDYEPELHEWMLRLTEEFDLTFPIKNEKANLVPCLMSEEEPEYDWPDVRDHPGSRENKMVYQFDYLPAGLFNRAQVRLYQFSDSSVIWKRGSLLRKNEHMAIMQQHRNSKVSVRVQGARPENILYLVHEVFETMIQESFHGVTYEYSFPCSHCLNDGHLDASMYSQKQILRASELKAPFIQCAQFFHIITITELHSLMLPSSGADFDVHLAKSMRELNDLKDDLTTDVFMFYCSKDIPPYGKEDQYVHPQRICEDMEQRGLRVWYPADPNLVDISQEAVAVAEAKVVLFCISDNFVNDPKCEEVFYYATKTVQKKIQLVLIGSSNKWAESSMGAHVATEVYVKMDNPKRYPSKVAELYEALKGKITGQERKRDFPPCFISYCWSNSRDAVSKGTRAPEGSLGWADPREFKDVLEKEGIPCWMDIERVGQSGLFEDIADGLKRAKVMVACVSDEYAKSKNCQMEMRFASVSLKVPIIIAVVGTGYKWESTEVGMLTLGCPKVNLQLESSSSMARLVELVQSHLPKTDKEEDSSHIKDKAQSNTAFKELLELAQWKFLRQMTTYAENMDIGSYPRLFAPDFITAEDVDNLNAVIKKIVPECVDGQSGDIVDDPNEAATGDDEAQQFKRKAYEMMGKLGAFNQLEGKLCMRIFCEHEEGWHFDSFGMPLKLMTETDEMEFLNTVAPYAARIMAILRHSSLNMPILKTEEGEKIRKKLEECVVDAADFKDQYRELRKHVMAADELRVMGGLARCYLPNGKTVWLCAKHQKGERVTVLTGESSSAVHMTPDADVLMAQEIAKQAANRPMSAARQRKASIRGKVIGAQMAALASSKYKDAKEKSLTAAAQTAAGKPASAGRKGSRACSIM